MPNLIVMMMTGLKLDFNEGSTENKAAEIYYLSTLHNLS